MKEYLGNGFAKLRSVLMSYRLGHIQKLTSLVPYDSLGNSVEWCNEEKRRRLTLSA